VEPLIGRSTATTRIVISHDVEDGLAEADHVLGLRGTSAVLQAPASTVSAADVRELYR
jgi:hypothetical protein